MKQSFRRAIGAVIGLVLAAIGPAALTFASAEAAPVRAGATTAASVTTAAPARSSCSKFRFRNLSYNAVLVGKKRHGKFFYVAVANIGPRALKFSAQRECHKAGKAVRIKRGHVHTFRVRVGRHNPRVRIWQQGAPFDIPAGTYPSKKGAFHLSTDTHPRFRVKLRNTTGHRAVLNIATARRGHRLHYRTASDVVKPGGTVRLGKKLAVHVRRVRVELGWRQNDKVRKRIVLDAPMLRLRVAKN